MCADKEFDEDARRWSRADRQGAMDLLVLQADARPGHLGVRAAGARLHPLPALQLDRAAARLDRDRQGGELRVVTQFIADLYLGKRSGGGRRGAAPLLHLRGRRIAG